MEKCTDHVKCTPTLSPLLVISTIPFFWFYHWTLTHQIIMILFSLTSWSYISFWFSGYNVLVTIFGNVHRLCKHYFIMVNKSLHLVYSSFFCCMAIFTSVTILGNADKPVNNDSTLSKRATSCLFFFFWFFRIFSLYLHWLLY